MATKRLELFSNTSHSIEAWNINRSNNDLAITYIDGWDDGVEIRRNSAPILWQHGEAQSTNALYDARIIEAQIWGQLNYTQMRALRQKLENIGKDLNSLKTVTVTHYNDLGVEFYKEELQCRMNDNAFDWEEINGTVTVTLYMVAPNPLKTVYIGGSTSPATDGRI